MQFSDEPPVVPGWYWVYTARDKQTHFVYISKEPSYWMEARAVDIANADCWHETGWNAEGEEIGEYVRDTVKIAKIEARPDSYYYVEYAGPVPHEKPKPTLFPAGDSRAFYR